MRASLIAVVVALCALAVQAATIERPLADPAQEQQARTLFSQLKCVVCEGQSLADSDAKLAVQMRAHIREMLAAGRNSDDVMAFFKTSYGERILMKPPVKQHTALLWLLPLLVLASGAWFVRKATNKGQGTHD
jgi:cytochrome c-type biogenesis protein CcmH